jgi:hypothetical protein
MDREPAARSRLGHDRQIDAAFDEPVEERHAGALGDLQLDARVLLANLCDEPRGDDGTERRGHAEDDLAGGARGGTANLLLGPLQLAQDARGMLMQLLAGVGQPDAAAFANEKRHTELLLETLHVAAQGGLGHVQIGRCSGDAAEFGDPDEVVETSDIHGPARHVEGVMPPMLTRHLT